MEIFLGIAPLPSSFDWFIQDEEAGAISAALAECFCSGIPWRQSREKVMAAYPVKKKLRRERFALVMAGLRDYTAEELDGELLDLHETFKILGGSRSKGTDQFLKDLRLRAESLKNQIIS